MKAALSLYVAVAVHLLALVLLALAAGAPQQPAGRGQGLGGPARAPEAPVDPRASSSVDREADRAADRSLARPVQAPAGEVPADVAALGLATAPLVLTATPRARVPEAGDAARAPARAHGADAPAGDGARGGGRGGYLADVRAHLNRYRRSLPGSIPTAASDVALTIDARGGVHDLRLQRSSGVAALDQEALDLVRRAAPLPAPPDGRARTLVVPILVD